MRDDSREKRRAITELLFGIFLLALLIVLFVMVMTYQPVARRAPLTVMIPLFVMLAAQLFIFYRRLKKLQSHQINDGKTEISIFKTRKLRKVLVITLFIISLMALIYLLGHVIGMAIFLIVFLRLVSRERWVLSLALGIGVPVALYLVFEKLLHIMVYPGIIHRYF